MHHGMGGCPTCGCGMGHGHRMGGFGMKAIFKMMPWKIMMHADELGLSEEQVEALRKRHSEAKKQMIQIKSQIMMDMIDVKDAIMREEPDMKVAEEKVREIGKLKGDKFMAMIQAMQDIRNILTPQQRLKIKEMITGWFKKGGMRDMEEEGEEGEEGESEEASEE